MGAVLPDIRFLQFVPPMGYERTPLKSPLERSLDIAGSFVSPRELSPNTGGGFISPLEFSPDKERGFVSTRSDTCSPPESGLSNFGLHPWVDNKIIPISITAPDVASALFITSPWTDIHNT